MHTSELLAFIKESNTIERLYPDPKGQLDIYEDFLKLKSINIVDLQKFVLAIQPDGILRDKWGLDVRIGNHLPPHGGPDVPHQLEYLLRMASEDIWHPYKVHIEYETLHPFMDGNGRSGRVLWLWQTLKYEHMLPIDGSFLHTFYYQTLDDSR